MTASLEGRSLYLCTPLRDDLDRFVDACVEGGVDVVQLRDKDADARHVLAAATRLAARLAEAGVPFLVNDRPDLALESGADGVHVGQDDAPVSLCRRILGPAAIVGLSTHTVAELATALDDDVTYLSAGPIAPTPTKPGRAGTGVAYAVEATARASVPVFVTGGVSAAVVGALVAAGLRRFVAVRALTEADDPRRAARALREAIDEALEAAR